MDKEQIKLIAALSEELETCNNEFMKGVVETYESAVAMNVLINTATSMMAKALILCRPETRGELEYLCMKIVDSKVAEGHAAVQSLVAIGKAMQSTHTGPGHEQTRN